MYARILRAGGWKVPCLGSVGPPALRQRRMRVPAGIKPIAHHRGSSPPLRTSVSEFTPPLSTPIEYLPYPLPPYVFIVYSSACTLVSTCFLPCDPPCCPLYPTAACSSICARRRGLQIYDSLVSKTGVRGTCQGGSPPSPCLFPASRTPDRSPLPILMWLLSHDPLSAFASATSKPRSASPHSGALWWAF